MRRTAIKHAYAVARVVGLVPGRRPMTWRFAYSNGTVAVAEMTLVEVMDAITDLQRKERERGERRA